MIKDDLIPEEINTTSLRKSFSYVGFGFFGFTILSSLLLPIVISTLLVILFPALQDHFFMGMPLIYIYYYVICLPLLLLFLKRQPDSVARVVNRQVKIPTLLSYYFIIAFLMMVINYAALLIDTLLNTSSTATTESLAALGMPQWLTFFFGVLVAPIMEEILFRWLPYKKLSGYGEKNYVIWTSVVFGLFHMNFGQSLYAGVAGIFLAYVTYRTGSIKYSIILHMLMNFFAGVGIGGFVLASGNENILYVYGFFNILCAVIGLVCLARLLIRKRKTFWLKEDRFNRSALFNLGTILYMIFPIIAIVSFFFI